MDYPKDKLLLAVNGLRALKSQLSDSEVSDFLCFAADAQEVVQVLELDTYRYIAGKRDAIIFGDGYYEDKYRGGLRYFKRLGRRDLHRLMDEHLFDPYPWRLYMEYVWFMERDPDVYLHGFVYSPERKDEWGRQCGISIEGIARERPFTDKESVRLFKYLFGRADQFDLDPPYVWYD